MTTKWSFYYRVKYYYDDGYFYESGLGICDGYRDAAEQIENRYGEALSSIEHIEIVEMTNLVVLPDYVCSNYANERYSDEELSCPISTITTTGAVKKED